jgi:hypothetical protein
MVRFRVLLGNSVSASVDAASERDRLCPILDFSECTTFGGDTSGRLRTTHTPAVYDERQ